MFPSGPPSWIEMVRELWVPGIWVFAASLLLSLLTTPLLRWLATKRGIVDRPDQAVKIHAEPIPYLGGCAIWLGWTVPVAIYLGISGSGHTVALLALLGGGTVAFATGLADDLLEIHPRWKLLGQMAAGAVLLAGGIMWFAYPNLPWFSPLNFGPDHAIVWVVCLAMHFFVVVGATNATNLLDGLDGLCSGVSAIIALGFLLLATSLAAHDAYGRGIGYEYPQLILILGFALAGAAIGFLPYNFNPARIFMGDAGSVFTGYVLAAMMVMFASRFGMVKWFVGALFIFGVPIFDTALALVRRVANRRPIMMPDRSHFYNQLVDKLGLSVRQAVTISYGLSIVFACAGLLVMYMPGRYAILIYLGIAAAAFAAAWALGFLHMTPEEQAAADRYINRRRADAGGTNS
jgi:UDP-GlcNAc:undecaprenyl-phosphate GlcNAc-1-phosphate transferase